MIQCTFSPTLRRSRQSRFQPLCINKIYEPSCQHSFPHVTSIYYVIHISMKGEKGVTLKSGEGNGKRKCPSLLDESRAEEKALERNCEKSIFVNLTFKKDGQRLMGSGIWTKTFFRFYHILQIASVPSRLLQRSGDPACDVHQGGGGHLGHHLSQPEEAVPHPRLQPVQPHPAAAGAELRIRRREDSAAAGHLRLPQEYGTFINITLYQV